MVRYSNIGTIYKRFPKARLKLALWYSLLKIFWTSKTEMSILNSVQEPSEICRFKGDRNISSIQLLFLGKVVRQSHTNMMSILMQFEKIGGGLLQEAFWSEGECVVSQKRGGK